MPYDHHRVRVAGRWGVLLTHQWMGAPPETPLTLQVVFRVGADYGLAREQSERAIQKHPPAPEEAQAVVDRLEFRTDA